MTENATSSTFNAWSTRLSGGRALQRRKTTRTAAVAGLLSLLCGLKPAQAATLQVGAGQTYATIQACITAAAAADVCNVHAGTYTETPTLSKSITVQNNTGEAPVLNGRVEFGATANATLIGLTINAPATNHAVHGDGGTGVTVRNVTVHGASGSGLAGLYFRNSTKVLLDGNTTYGNDVGIEIISGHSTDATYPNGVTISNNVVHDNITDGMEIHGQYLTVSGNSVYNNLTANWANTHPDGIQLIAGAADGFTSVQHAMLYNNTIKNHTQNIFIEGTLSGQSSDVSDIWVFNNVLFMESGTVNGVALDTLPMVNLIVKFAKNAYLFNNYIGRAGGNGIRVMDSFDGSIHIKNNIINNTLGYGLDIENAGDIAAGELDNNFYGTSGNSPIVWNAGFYDTLAAFHTAVPSQETHGKSGNPLTNAVPTPTLQTGSPVIGMGVSLTGLGVVALNSDKAGVARGTTWDAGPYEASGGSTPPPPPPPTGSVCDINQDGSTNVADVQNSVNQALGMTTCTADVNQDGKCNIIDVQRVVNAALGGTCVVTP